MPPRSPRTRTMRSGTTSPGAPRVRDPLGRRDVPARLGGAGAVHRPLGQEEEAGFSNLPDRLRRGEPDPLRHHFARARGPSELEVLLKAGDVTDQPLPKRSMVKVGKLFTMHRRLIASRFGTVEQGKLREVLDRLRALFADRTEHPEDAGEASRTQEVDEAVLALLHLN